MGIELSQAFIRDSWTGFRQNLETRESPAKVGNSAGAGGGEGRDSSEAELKWPTGGRARGDARRRIFASCSGEAHPSRC